MKLPQEIELWYIIPAIRREFSRHLAESGMKQKEIASLLGVTEAAVSHYIKSKRAAMVDFTDSIMKEIKRSAERIKSGSSTQEEIYRITMLCRKEKVTCSIHKSVEQVPEHCSVCYSG